MSETRPFGSLLSYPLRSGVTVAKDARGEGIRMVNMGELFKYPRLRNVEMSRVAIDIADKDRYLLDNGDLLFARRSLTLEGAGKCALVIELSEATTWESSIIRARIDRAIAEPAYYYYYFSSPLGRRAVESIVEQVAAAGIRSSDLARLEVPLPTLGEQRSVAAVLGALDDKIAVNERIAQTSRELGLVLFQRALESGGEELSIASLTETLSRGVAPKYTDDQSELLVLNQKCVRGGRVALAPARRTLAAKVPSAKQLQTGDVLVNSTGVGTLGRVARWTGHADVTVDSHITIVRFDQSKVNQLCAGFAMLAAQPEIERLGEGSTGQTELSRAKLGELSLRLPKRSDQNVLSGKLGALEERGDAALSECHSLAKLRDALLPGLMSGVIGVRDAERAVEDAL